MTKHKKTIAKRFFPSIFPPLLFDIFALLLGSIVPLAFAPFHLFWISPLALGGFLLIAFHSTAWRSLWRGWLFGIGMFGVGVSWVFISVHTFGETNVFFASIITALLIIELSLFPMLMGYVTRSLSSAHRLVCLVALPSTWTLLEWLRGTLLTGFPWLLLGYSQTNSPLRGFAPLIGTYGISFLIMASACLLVFFLKDLTLFSRKKLKPILFTSLAFVCVWTMGEGLSCIRWTHPTGDPIRVALIQGNIPQAVKWTVSQITPTLIRYQQLTNRSWNNDLIVWPEAAIPLTLSQASSYITPLDQWAKKHHTHILVGVPLGESPVFYNAAVMLGESHGYYTKRHLVPFGEYLPLEKWLRGLIGFFDLPMSSFSPGPLKQPLLRFKQWQISTSICYETAYAGLMLRDLPQANILITITNDAWFGDSLAFAQHLQMGQMRSLESGRYMLFVANTGITAIINPEGNIIKALPRSQTAVLSGNIYAMKGATPFVRYWGASNPSPHAHKSG